MRFASVVSVVALSLILGACGVRQPETPKAPETKPPVAPAVQPAPPPEKPKPLWQTYHGPASLDGVSTETLPDKLGLIWRCDISAPIPNSPVVDDGHICVADTKGSIHSVDLNGKPLWSKTFTEPSAKGRPPLPLDFGAPLALFDSTLIACASSGKIYALNVADGETRWSRDTELPVLGTPNVADVNVDGKTQKRLFVIDQSEGALQAFDFATGAPIWKGDGPARCDGSPSVNGSFAVYGSCAAALHIFDTVTGKLLREVTIDEDSQVAGGVVLLDDLIFSGSRSGKVINANARTGKTIWINSDCDGESFSTPAVSADRVIFGANTNMLYSLDRNTGKLQWKQKFTDTPSSAIVVGDKAAVAVAGTLYLLRLSDGQTVWSYPVSDEITSPSLAGTLIVVGAGDGTLTAFGAKAGA